MIFLEIKHIFEARYAKNIIERGIEKLDLILQNYAPHMNGKNLKQKRLLQQQKKQWTN